MKEDKVITIDEQVEAMTDMMPLIAKNDQPVFEEIIKTLELSKASVFSAQELMIELGALPELNPEDPQSVETITTKSSEAMTKFANAIKSTCEIPEWAKQIFTSENIEDIIFPEDYKPKSNEEKAASKKALKNLAEKSITDGQVVFRKRYEKTESFGSDDTYKYYIDICVSTPSGVEMFDQLTFGSEEARDKRLSEMIEEYPEDLTVDQYKSNKAEERK